LLFKKKHPWYRARGYIHFDEPISFKKAQRIVTSPKKVAKHAFYPLINYSVNSKKIKQDKKTRHIEVKVKERPISYSSHVDSHIYSYYTNLLSKLYEEQLEQRNLEENVLAFRSLGKSNIDFAYEAFQEIKKFGKCSAVALDLSKFFDTLDHGILKREWSKLIQKKQLPPDHYNLFKSLTKFAVVDRQELYELLGVSVHNPRNGKRRLCEPAEFRNNVRKSGLIIQNKGKEGIPQGSPISALLSNVYMIEFDDKMKSYVDSIGGKYYRYCDDMLFIVPQSLKNKVAGIAAQEIGKLKVRLNIDKTERRTFRVRGGKLVADTPLQYLGFLFDGENIYLRSTSLARYSERMRKGVRLAKATMRKRNSLRVQRGESPKPLFKNKLYRKYSHLGSMNFITYGMRAAETMQSKTIKKQLKPLWDRLQEEMK